MTAFIGGFMNRHIQTVLVAFLAAAPAIATAQQTPTRLRPAVTAGAEEGSRTVSPRHADAQAAGYRALHLCTGTFSSGLPQDLIDRTGSGQTARDLPTVIDRDNKIVTVKFADDMQPRIAAWRPALGCTQLPIGATLEMVEQLPRLPAALEIPNFDAQPWPMGDVKATATLPKTQSTALAAVLEDAFKNQDGTYRGNTCCGSSA
jgi:hypothetical protein